MTTYYATSLDAHGEILQTGSASAPDGLAEAARHPGAVGPVLIGTDPPPENAYRLGGEWVSKPAQPSMRHTWDAVAKVWAPPPVVTPSVVTMRQARLVLAEVGLLSSVQAAIDALPSQQREAAQIEWEFASEVRRDWQLLRVLGVTLGLSAAALDELFIRAGQL